MRVGVVIPSYNHASFVAEAIGSVLDQTHADVELVVVDDGSKDGSPGLIRDVFARYPGRRTTLIAQENRGANAAIARGFAELDTPVCAVLNSDDLYEPDRFERMLPMLDGPLAIAFSGLHLIDDAGRTLPPDHAWSRWYATALTAADTEPTIGFALLVHNFSVTSGNFVFTRALYDRLDGFGDQKFAHDWDFLIRSVALTEPVFVPDRLMRYRVHASNTTESVRGLMHAECEAALERYAQILVESGVIASETAPCGSRWPSYWRRFAHRKGFLGDTQHARWYARLSPSNQ